MNDRYERKPQKMVRGYRGLREFIPLGETELRKRVADGVFPQPMQLGTRSVAWFLSDVVKMQESLRRK